MLDTNILLDWLLDRDPARSAQIDSLFSSDQKLDVLDVVITELVFALEIHYQLPRAVVYQNVLKVAQEPALHCNRELINGALNYYLKHPALSFIDCYLLASASARGNQSIWTFDKKLINQASGKACSPL